MDPQRRRLTVAKCSPVDGDGGADAATAGSPNGHPALKLQQAGLFEVFSRDELCGKRACLITSVTDVDLKRRNSFGKKDEQVLVPLGCDERELVPWVKSLGISWCCKKGLKPESPNQDSFSVLVVEGQFALYGVFDGHGPSGHDVSDLARQVLVKLFVTHAKRSTDPGLALTEAFLETQRVLEATDIAPSTGGASTSGTTCTVAYHDMVRETVTIAHVGDSRSVLGRRADKKSAHEVEDLTIDHKPNLEKERQRIESANPPGRVVFDGFYNHRVFAQNGMYPGLNMSRALGDVIAHKEAGLTAEPDVKTIDLQAERAKFSDLTLLLCTDGVWEFIDSKEAMAMVAPFDKADSGKAAEKLAQESWNRWMQDSDNEISDDITAILVHLGS